MPRVSKKPCEFKQVPAELQVLIFSCPKPSFKEEQSRLGFSLILSDDFLIPYKMRYLFMVGLAQSQIAREEQNIIIDSPISEW